MGFARMVAAHLLEQCKDLFLPLVGNSSLNQSSDGLFIRVNIRRQPKCHPRAGVDRVGAALFKGLTAECPDKVWKINAVLMRIGVQPTGSGVRAKRQHHNIDGRRFFSCSYGLDPWSGHVFSNSFSIPKQLTCGLNVLAERQLSGERTLCALLERMVPAGLGIAE